MIDKTRIEPWAAMTEKPGELSVSVDVGEMADLAREYLALRAIVEALAASEQIILDDGRFTCCHCGAKTVARYEVNGHKQDCRWRKARALVGPAGGERAETRS